jgi:hypothetical protein
MKNKKESFFNQLRSPIPRHLSPEEQILWEEEYEWELQERERRRKQGFYDEKPKKKRVGWKTIQNLFRKKKKW